MSFKSSNFRRTHDTPDAPTERSNAKVRQLQEMFPTWSDEDLKSLLLEVNYDIELAATRISEGHAEQWGAVIRKKDKRSTPASSAPASSDRGGSRGARGGRGGARGGRGGARGTGRGGHRETNGRHAPSPAPQASTSSAQAAPAPAAATADAATSIDWSNANGTPDPAATSGWGDIGDSSANVEAPSVSKKPDTTPIARVNGATPAAQTDSKSQAPTPAPAPIAKPAGKTPATSKMSWAQIAKPQEKPKPAPSPAPPPAAQPAPEVSAPVPPAAPASEPDVVPPEPEQTSQPEDQGWEEPTTAQAPTWDDELSAQPTVKATADGWITSVSSQTEAQPEPTLVQVPLSPPPKQPEPQPEQLPAPSAFPAQLGLQQKTDSTVAPPAKPSTPVSYARSLNSRAGNRFKATDQAVIMPSTFGSSVEKLGMQFGSVNLGGEDVDINAPEPSAPEAPAPATTTAEPARESQPQATHAPPPEPAPASKEQSPIISKSLFQQAAAPQQPQQQPQVQQQQQPLLQIHPSLQSTQPPPSLLPTQPSAQSTASTATSTPLTSFSAQQQTPSSQSSISPYQQHSAQQQSQASQTQPPSQSHLQQHQHQQQQSQLHQQFSHFQSHLDQPASSQSPSQSQQPQQQQSSLHQGIAGHGSYYRQPEQSFQHAATPPAGQGQEAAYGSFTPLSQQLGYQTQSSHLGGFGSEHFGYNEGPRGFYEYGQQSTFGGRNALGHDDLGKSLPGSQQGSQTGAGLPQSVQQSAQQQAGQQPQSAGQPQGPTGQPQQGYAPLPYYYNPYQPGQFYGAPYGSGYGLGQYANRYPQQQPPMFQPTNPTSAASPANAKGPSSVQQQSNPYAAPGLYGQQHASSAYDDGYGHHNQLGPQHTPGVGGLPTNDYGKPLYGGQGIQSFMGQSSTPVQLGQRGAGTSTSPENSYKPYGGPGVGVGAKDVGGAPGVGSGIAGGQSALGQAGRGGVQQPSQFYGANRFSSNPGAGGPPGQQAGQQQNQGYPQGATDNFYYGRPSQNGPQYWA